jgi:hypothetical protein
MSAEIDVTLLGPPGMRVLGEPTELAGNASS